MKHVQEDGTEIDVFTADEVATQVTAAKTAVEGEWKPKFDEATKKLTAAEQAAAVRAVEFGQFRKLSEEQVKQLSEKDAVIYRNQELLAEAQQRETDNKKTAHDSAVATAIRAKVGSDEKLFEKVKETYQIVTLKDETPEEIAVRVTAALGVLGSTQPDLLASAGFSTGSYAPPVAKKEGEATFADSEQGKEFAAKLGITLEKPKA